MWRFTGHADQIGTKTYNYRLSEKRAEYVVKTLMRYGVKREQILRVQGFGEDLPICISLAESCRKYNRRVEIHFIY